MRVHIILAILAAMLIFPATANAIDQQTIDNLKFLLSQPEDMGWGDGKFDDQTLYDGLLTIYQQESNGGDINLARQAMWAMGETGIVGFAPTLIGAMDSEPLTVCYALGKISSNDGVYALIEMLGDEDMFIRDAAVTSLGTIEYIDGMDESRQAALDSLTVSMQSETELWIRDNINGAITMIETGVAIEPEFVEPLEAEGH
ncbi:MAG TPA: HEAT repeat domain-containing protein [bacterium]|jgi:hypothetical protein